VFYEMPIETLAASLGNHKRLNHAWTIAPQSVQSKRPAIFSRRRSCIATYSEAFRHAKTTPMGARPNISLVHIPHHLRAAFEVIQPS
jgi:hypothetical protein